jgi:predicted GNAT superfamily acetyltransferase
MEIGAKWGRLQPAWGFSPARSVVAHAVVAHALACRGGIHATIFSSLAPSCGARFSVPWWHSCHHPETHWMSK